MKTKFKETEIGMIPEDWEMVTIPDIASNFDNKRKPLSSAERSKMKGQYPYYGAAGIIDYVNGYKYDGDYLLIAEDGTVTCDGFKPMLQLPRGKFWVSNHAHVLQSDSYSDTLFLYYQLKNTSVNAFITGAVQPKLSQENLNKIKFPWVKNDEERGAITKILSDIDSKIELNHQINKTLEAMSQALFKRWFVDFEFPNEKGKPYKLSDGEMVDSEMGEIPRGWQVSKLGDCGTFKNGINYLRDEAGDTDFFIANVRDIANNKLLLKESLDKIKINFSKARDYLLKEKDILIARSASPGEISLVLGDLEKVIYSGFSIRYRLNNPNNYLYMFLVMQGLKRNLLNFSIGTTLQSVNQETLKNMKFILPSDEILKAFNKISEQILNKTFNNLLQNKELSQIRDSLLPRLMSGKIRVAAEGGDKHGE